MLYQTQLRTLKLILAYARTHHQWPSSRDIARKRNVSNAAALHSCQLLVKQGYLTRLPLGQHCGYTLTHYAYSTLGNPRHPIIAATKPPKATQLNSGKRAAWYKLRHSIQRIRLGIYDIKQYAKGRGRPNPNSWYHTDSSVDTVEP